MRGGCAPRGAPGGGKSGALGRCAGASAGRAVEEAMRRKGREVARVGWPEESWGRCVGEERRWVVREC